MSDAKVLIEEKGPLWEITLNAPERRNALGRAVVEGVLEAAARVAEEKAVRAVILRGEGKNFCAGADLKERKGMPEPEVRETVSRLNRMMQAIDNSPKVWVAAVHGPCLGGGLELALCCDFRIGRDDAIIGLPEVRLGILPGAGGTQRLPRMIGIAKAKELILTGMRVPADEAHRLGVLNRVADDHIAAARAFAEEVCKAAPISLTQAKRAVDKGWDLHMEAALTFERTCYDVTLPTQDRLEGLAAFAEKRAPNYKGE